MVETIVCINNEKFEIPLTVGKKYSNTILSSNSGYIKDDTGKCFATFGYKDKLFISIEEWREQLISKLIDYTD